MYIPVNENKMRCIMRGTNDVFHCFHEVKSSMLIINFDILSEDYYVNENKKTYKQIYNAL